MYLSLRTKLDSCTTKFGQLSPRIQQATANLQAETTWHILYLERLLLQFLPLFVISVGNPEHDGLTTKI